MTYNDVQGLNMTVDTMMDVDDGGIRKPKDSILRTSNAGIVGKELNLSKMRIDEEEH